MGEEDLQAENTTLREKLARYEALAKKLHGKTVSELEAEHQAFAALANECSGRLHHRLRIQMASLRGRIDLLKELQKCL